MQPSTLNYLYAGTSLVVVLIAGASRGPVAALVAAAVLLAAWTAWTRW